MRRKKEQVQKSRLTIHLCQRRSPERVFLVSNQFELQFAQFLHAACDSVARLKPNLLLLGMAQNHTFWCPRENYVPGLESHVPRNIADNLRAGEYEILGIRRLPSFSVNSTLNLELVRIDLFSGNQIRTQGGKLIRRNSGFPYSSTPPCAAALYLTYILFGRGLRAKDVVPPRSRAFPQASNVPVLPPRYFSRFC